MMSGIGSYTLELIVLHEFWENYLRIKISFFLFYFIHLILYSRLAIQYVIKLLYSIAEKSNQN